MPKNLLEISQYVANLWGKVSAKTLLAQVPFVDNVEEELQAVEEENQKALERQPGNVRTHDKQSTSRG